MTTCIRLGIALSLVLAPALAHAVPASIASFPAEWVEAIPDLYPITQQPAPVQWQATLAVRSLAQAGPNEPVLIEVHGASRTAGERVLRYMVDHHGFPEARFIVAVRPKNTPWRGWITVRPESMPLPERAPTWELPVIHSSLASPMSPEEAAMLYRYSETREDVPETGENRARFRPAIGLEWFNLQTDPREKYSGDRWQASWVGVRAGGEAALVIRGPMEYGLGVAYFTSLTGLDESAVRSRITVTEGGLFALAHLEPSDVGLVQLRADLGFHGNWRDREDRAQFSPPLLAPQLKLGVSTSFDDAIRMGAHLGYAFSEKGAWQVGGKLSHRLFAASERRWDMVLGLNLSLARFARGSDVVQESWSTVQVGLSGSI